MFKIIFRLLEIMLCIICLYLDIIIYEYLYYLFLTDNWWSYNISCPMIFINACTLFIFIIYITIYDIFITSFGIYEKMFNYGN